MSTEELKKIPAHIEKLENVLLTALPTGLIIHKYFQKSCMYEVLLQSLSIDYKENSI